MEASLAEQASESRFQYDGSFSEQTYVLDGAIRRHDGQGEVYAATANPVRGTVVALHGSGRSAESYRRIPFYRYQRDRALRSGFRFVALSNGPDTWGRDAGLDNVLLLIDRLGNGGTGVPTVLWATSAGGVLAHRTASRRSISGIILTFAVYDLESTFETSKGCAAAWGAGTRSEFLTAIAGRNPPDFVADVAYCPCIAGHGLDDAVVPYHSNTARLADDLRRHHGSVEVRTCTGGHSTDNYEVYDDQRIEGFLAEVAPPTSAGL